jgi:CDP-glucose 4,6-dehydratase
VLEPIGGYLLLGGYLHDQPASFSKPYNFGPLPEGHLTVKDLVETAIASWGSGNWKDSSSPASVHEAGLLKLDISRAVNELGWTPKLDARQAIQWTLEWYRQPVTEQASFTFQQINTYFSL